MKYQFYTTNEIKPLGWLKRQLEIQRGGLSGNLDKIWPDIRDSKWIGGEREGWERVPYWLDGAVPLAYLLDDEDLKRRVHTYIDAIVARQEEDGWICPCEKEERTTYDTWAVLLITKVLLRYYECSCDERIPMVLYRCMKNYYDLLSTGTVKLFNWGQYRWYEGFPALNFLYARYGEEWMLSLAKILKNQGIDYRNVEETWKRPLNKWTLYTHIVNLVQMLKSETLSNDLLGEEYQGLADEYYELLYRYNGTAVGTFTGDECLSGISPIQGTELCAVVELMDSLEKLYAYTGEAKWADILERVAFNALPATISEDMWSHQYVQQVNQIDCRPFPGKSVFRTNNKEAHVFGLEPHFGCCTSNMHQGWPKLTLSAFLYGNNEIVSALPIPTVLHTETKGGKLTITLDSDYPFKTVFRYLVESEKRTDVTFRIRLPKGVRNVVLNGESRSSHRDVVIHGFKAGTTVLELSYTFDIHFEKRPDKMYCVTRGPLVYALPIAEEWTPVEYVRRDVERKFPYCDYAVKGMSKWNYAFASRDFTFAEHKISDVPFSAKNPPVSIAARMTEINWGLEDGYETCCAKSPADTTPLAESEILHLVPYGCARLRMTEMPIAKKSR